MPQYDFSTYQATFHQQREDYDDGAFGGANEPPRDMGINDMQTNFKRAGIGVAAYATTRAVANDVRQTAIYRSGREDIDRTISNVQVVGGYLMSGFAGFKLGGPIGAGIGFGAKAATDISSEIGRRKRLEVENVVREEDRKLKGNRIRHSKLSGAYYE
jgi:hypothetical protein